MSRVNIRYDNLNIKTNKNYLGKHPTLQLGISLPDNHQKRIINQLETNHLVKKITLPQVMYHTTLKPIAFHKLHPNKIFYVSYDKFQSLAHGLDQAKNHQMNDKVYLYELTPKQPSIQAVVFDEINRPKKFSNATNLRFNKPTNKTMFRLGFQPDWIPTEPRNTLIMSNKTFAEGSGDNMILGHLICKSGAAVNGIRNTHNQNELGFCDPRNFLNFEKVSVMSAEHARAISHYSDIVFNKGTLPMGYKFMKQNIHPNVNVDNLLSTIYSNKQKETKMINNYNALKNVTYRLKKIGQPKFVYAG